MTREKNVIHEDRPAVFQSPFQNIKARKARLSLCELSQEHSWTVCWILSVSDKKYIDVQNSMHIISKLWLLLHNASQNVHLFCDIMCRPPMLNCTEISQEIREVSVENHVYPYWNCHWTNFHKTHSCCTAFLNNC